MQSRTKRALTVTATASALSAALVGTASTAPPIRVQLRPRVVEYGASRVSVSRIEAASVSVRLRGANDPAGAAYEWTPYRWQRLTRVAGSWHGVLPAPPLHGVYQLQLKIGQRRQLLQAPHWLVRALPGGTLKRPAFTTPRAVIRDFVRHLPGNQVLVRACRWPQAAFDHRDPRLQRLLVIAYAPRGDDRPSARLGLFVTAVRDGYGGRWRLLEATTAPYD